LTAQTCKRKPGLKRQYDKKDPPHGVADTLLRQLAYDRVARDENGRWRIQLPFQYKCPECGHRTETYAQVIEARAQGHYHKPVLSSHRQTRVGINRARLTAEEGLLYSVRAIDEGSLFVGFLEAPEDKRVLAEKWLGQITRLGGRTSRGFGRVDVTLGTPPAAQPLSNRVRDFNDRYRQFEADLIEIADDPPLPETRILFTINLLSDALLRDGAGLPTLRFDEAMLSDALNVLLTEEDQQVLSRIELKRIAQFVMPQYISGWQTAWQLPKEVLLAAQMGGLYVFAANCGQDQSNKDNLIEWLGKLEAAGIGEAREDGFGQIVISDSFHLEVNPV
jgi:CRISPR-associated Csx10 family RAMP protein